MQVTTEAIKALREQTQAGIMECKKALQETDGDIKAATAMLQERGYEIAKKKESRHTGQGLVECYIHVGGRIGAMVEVNCESDFVARTPEFKELAHDLAMQVAATNPRYLDKEDVPEGEGYDEEECLLIQPFIKDLSKRVEDVVAEMVVKVRENVRISRFARFQLGSCSKDE